MIHYVLEQASLSVSTSVEGHERADSVCHLDDR